MCLNAKQKILIFLHLKQSKPLPKVALFDYSSPIWFESSLLQVVLYWRDLNGFWISGCIHLIISRNFPAALQAVMLSPCLLQICYITFEKSTFEHLWYQSKFFLVIFFEEDIVNDILWICTFYSGFFWHLETGFLIGYLAEIYK